MSVSCVVASLDAVALSTSVLVLKPGEGPNGSVPLSEAAPSWTCSV